MTNKYAEKILQFSLRLNEAQRPIRILDSVKIPDDVEHFLLQTNCREIPKISYDDRPLKYDLGDKRNEFKNLLKDLSRDFSKSDAVYSVFERNINQYLIVLEMLNARGRKEFFDFSKELYGHPHELLSDGKNHLYELSFLMDGILENLDQKNLSQVHNEKLSDIELVDKLKYKLDQYFLGENIKVKISDGIVSDASAGSDYIKIKKGGSFSQRDLQIFEVHEGWVHLGTTINGEKQKFAKWLSKGPPCSTVTQEGLAVITELFNFALYPKRARRLNDRILACKMAREGADLLQVIEFYRVQGANEKDAIANACRIFRGADLNGGAPFTKDISYLKGFIQIYNFIRSSVKEGKVEQIPFLFAGKVTLEDVPLLYELYQENIVDFPTYLPPQFKDLNGLAVWMAFSNFLNKMKIDDHSKVLKLFGS